MITTGQSITNPVTGETLVFRKTAADTNGEAVVVEAFVEPDGAVAAAHVHPAQEERFEVLAGELEFRVRQAEARRTARRPGRSSPPEHRTGSGTSARRRRTSSARCGPRSASSS